MAKSETETHPLHYMDIRLGYWRWRLYRWNEQPNPYRHRPADALQWLLQYQKDPGVMAELRSLLDRSATGGYSSSDPLVILGQIAEKMASGEFLLAPEIFGHVSLELPVGSPAGASTPPTALPASKNEVKPDKAPPPAKASDSDSNEPTLKGDTDPAAMAQSLKDAAKDGAPFCEECAKAAAEQAAVAQPQPDPDPDVDPATATVMKQASRKGVPFVQECAKKSPKTGGKRAVVMQ
jgi:hypothetical protein